MSVRVYVGGGSMSNLHVRLSKKEEEKKGESNLHVRTLFWTVGKEKEVKSKDGNKQQDCAGLCHLLLEMYRDGKRKNSKKLTKST